LFREAPMSRSRFGHWIVSAVALCAVLALSLAAALAQKPVTNAELLRMVKAHTPERTLLLAIQRSPKRLDAPNDALMRLKHAGASEAIIGAVINQSQGKPVEIPDDVSPAPSTPRATKPPDAAPQTAPDKQNTGDWHSFSDKHAAEEQMESANTPDYPDDPGVYYKGPNGWTQIHEVQSSRMRAKGVAAAVLTDGIAPVKQIEVFIGPHAPLQINDPRPTFYFVDILETPPRDIAIVSLTINKDRREVQIGSAGAFKRALEYRRADIHEVVTRSLGDNIIAVTARDPLPPGEYFIGLAHTPTINGFDFGIAGAAPTPAHK
jgi:hypothetical protein